jgi:hypothetical protein
MFHHQEVEAPGEIVKIYCEANPEYYLTAKEDSVVLAPGDESNPYQQWIIDGTWGIRVKDSAGFPAFALINKATRQALRHGKEEKEKVHTCPYSKDELNEVVLWTQSDDVGNGYKCIRPVDNTDLNLDANHGDPESGGIQDGTDLILFKWKKQDNQKWKILPISFNPISQVQKYEAEDTPYGGVPKYGGVSSYEGAQYGEDVQSYGGASHGKDVPSYGSAPYGEGVPNYEGAPYAEGVPNYEGAPYGERTDKVTNYEGPAYAVHTHHHHHDFPQHIPEGQSVRIYCEQSPEYFLTVRDGEVVLTPGDADDVSQHWIKVDEWGNKIRDEVGFPAFALVSKATLKALKHGSQEWDRVELSYYNENDLDESVLWTQSADVGRGYQCIRPVGNIHLNIDAKLADGRHGNVEDGNELILFSWKKQKNQKWKMLPVD